MADTVSTRSSRRRSVSSILKSPSRAALVDINPNEGQEKPITKGKEKKKRRRSSKRVSFAETFKVQEFLKADDATELGFFEISVSDQPPVHTSEETTDTRFGVDSSSVPASSHQISGSGLETLLSAPIKHTSTEPSTEQNGKPSLRDASDACAATDHEAKDSPSSNNDVCDIFKKFQFTSFEDQVSPAKEDCPQSVQPATEINDLFSKFNFISDDTSPTEQSAPGGEKTIFFQSQQGEICGDMEMTNCFYQNQSIVQHKQYKSSNDASANISQETNSNMKSIQPIIDPEDGTYTQRIHYNLGLLAPEYHLRIQSCESFDSDALHNSSHHSVSSLDNSASRNLSQLHGSADISHDMNATCSSQLAYSGNLRREITAKQHVNEDYDDKTRVFSSADATAAMEMTTCLNAQYSRPGRGIHGENTPEQTVYYGAKDVSAQMDFTQGANSLLVKNNCGNEGDKEDEMTAMEITTGIGNIQEMHSKSLVRDAPNLVCGEQRDFTDRMEDFIFKPTNFGATGDFCFRSDEDVSKNSLSRENSSDENKTQYFGQDDFKKEMDLTNYSNRSIRSIKDAKNEPEGIDKTRVFSKDDTTAGMELTTCISNASIHTNKSSHANARSGDGNKTRQFGDEDVTGHMELTLCNKSVNVRERFGISKEKSVVKTGDKTEIFDQEGTAGAMDFISCLKEPASTHESFHPCNKSGNKLGERHSDVTDVIVQKKANKGMSCNQNETKMFSRDDVDRGMDLTSCLEVFPDKISSHELTVTHSKSLIPSHTQNDMPNKQHNQARQDMMRVFNQDATAAGMEMTACISNVGNIQEIDPVNESNGEGTMNEQKQQENEQEPEEKDMEFTTTLSTSITGDNVRSKRNVPDANTDKENVPIIPSEKSRGGPSDANLTLHDGDFTESHHGPLESTKIFSEVIGAKTNRRSNFFPASALKANDPTKRRSVMDNSRFGDMSVYEGSLHQSSVESTSILLQQIESLLLNRSSSASKHTQGKSFRKELFQSKSHSKLFGDDKSLTSDQKGKRTVKTEEESVCEEQKSQMLKNPVSSDAKSVPPLSMDTNQRESFAKRHSISKARTSALLDELPSMLGTKASSSRFSFGTLDEKLLDTTQGDNQSLVTSKLSAHSSQVSSSQVRNVSTECTNKRTEISLDDKENEWEPPAKIPCPGTEKISREDEDNKTKVFDANENTAQMEQTCVPSFANIGNAESVQSLGYKDAISSGDERTRIFGGEIMAEMEITCAVSDMVPDQVSSASQKRQLHHPIKNNVQECENVQVEVSRDQDRHNCSMIVGSQVHVEDNMTREEDERTKVFDGENTARMEITKCLPSFAALNDSCSSSGLSGNTCEVNRGESDKTKLFGVEDTGRMEFTMCVTGAKSESKPILRSFNSSGLPEKASQNLMKDGERTKIFGKDETDRMEITVGFHQEQPFYNSGNAQSELNEDSKKNKYFSKEDTNGMEFTVCAAQSQPCTTTDVQVPRQVVTDVHRETDERTRIFDNENTAKMEITKCLPSFATLSKSYDATDFRGEGEGDKTKIFGREETGRMEFTVCMPSQQHKKTSNHKKSGASESLPNKNVEITRVFGKNDTGEMKFTKCVSQVNSDLEARSDVSKAKEDGEKTQIFGKDETGGMEFTVCVPQGTSASKPNHAVPQSHPGDSDKTVYFQAKSNKGFNVGENTTQMEETCMGSNTTGFAQMLPTFDVSNTTTKISFPKFGSGGIIPDDTSRMEVFGVGEQLSESMKVGDSKAGTFGDGNILCQDGSTSPGAVSQDKKITDENVKEAPQQLDQQHSSESDDGSSSVPINQREEEEGQRRKESKRDSDTFTIGSEEGGNKTGSTALAEMTAQSTISSSSQNKKTQKQRESALPEWPTDVSYTSTKISFPKFGNGGIIPDDTSRMEVFGVGEQLSESMKVGDSNAGTFEDGNILSQNGSTSQGAVSQNKKITDEDVKETPHQLDQQHSSESDDGSSSVPINQREEKEGQRRKESKRDSDTFTIGSEEDGNKTGSVASAEMTAQSTISSLSQNEEPQEQREFALPEWPTDAGEVGIMEEMMELNAIDTTEDLDVALGKFAFQKDQNTAKNMNLSQGEMSFLASKLSSSFVDKVDTMSILEFTQQLISKKDLDDGRRATFVMNRTSKPETLEDFLNVSLINKPRQETFEWAAKYVTTSVKQLTEQMHTYGQVPMKEKFPALIEELEGPNGDQVFAKVKELHEFCSKFSRFKFNEWQTRIQENLMSTMKDSSEVLESLISQQNESLTAIDIELKQADAAIEELENSIKALEDLPLPSYEDRRRYLENGSNLETLNTDCEEMTVTLEQREGEKASLETKFLELMDQHVQLQTEDDALESEVKLIENLATDIKNTERKVHHVESLLEWHLDGIGDDGNKLEIAFLEGSITLSVQFESFGERTGHIKQICFESLLADDACKMAKVCHHLIIAAVKLDDLKTKYSTKEKFPQLLQEISRIVTTARLLEDEVRHVEFWHLLSIEENRLSVLFSDVDSLARFEVVFALAAGTYPGKSIPTTVNCDFGRWGEKDVQDAIESVQPGWRLFSRIVDHLQQLVQSGLSTQTEM